MALQVLDFLRKFASSVTSIPIEREEISMEDLIRNEYDKFLRFFYSLHPTQIIPINEAKVEVNTQFPYPAIFFKPSQSMAKDRLIYVTAVGLKVIDGVLIWTITRCDDCHNFVGPTVLLRYRPTYEEILGQLKEAMVKNLDGPFSDSGKPSEKTPEKAPEKVLEKVPEKPSERAPEKPSERAPEKKLKKAPDEADDVVI
jgi:hypothetical protein